MTWQTKVIKVPTVAIKRQSRCTQENPMLPQRPSEGQVLFVPDHRPRHRWWTSAAAMGKKSGISANVTAVVASCGAACPPDVTKTAVVCDVMSRNVRRDIHSTVSHPTIVALSHTSLASLCFKVSVTHILAPHRHCSQSSMLWTL